MGRWTGSYPGSPSSFEQTDTLNSARGTRRPEPFEQTNNLNSVEKIGKPVSGAISRDQTVDIGLEGIERFRGSRHEGEISRSPESCSNSSFVQMPSVSLSPPTA